MSHQAAIVEGLEAIVLEQGWTESTLLGLALDFIHQNDHDAPFVMFCHGTYDHAASPPACVLPQHADDVIRDLVDQIEGIGIEDWHGAEGLSLGAARQFLSIHADAYRAGRIRQSELDAVTWDEADFPYADWQAEVAEGATRRSYADWVLAMREQASDNREQVQQS